MKDICAALGIAIRLKTVRADGSDSRQENFGPRGAPAYALGLYEEHYFLIDPVPITAYAIEHFDQVKHLPDFTKVTSVNARQVSRRADRFVDSARLFQLLLANREALLEPIVYCDAIQQSAYYDKITAFGSLEYNPD